MPYRLTERVVDDTIALLRTNFPARLSALGVELPNIRLENIKQYYIAEQVETPPLPAIFVLGDSAEILLDRPGYAKTLHALTISVLAGDTDSEELRRKLYRYTRIIFEILKESGRAILWRAPAIDYSPVFDIGGVFVSDARVMVNMKVEEVR